MTFKRLVDDDQIDTGCIPEGTQCLLRIENGNKGYTSSFEIPEDQCPMYLPVITKRDDFDSTTSVYKVGDSPITTSWVLTCDLYQMEKPDDF